MPIILFLLTIITRLPFTSKYIYHSDSGNFILGMKHYDVMLHQPHPPGYFLYVMLGRVCNFIVPDAHYSLILLSIIFSGLTVVTVYFLGREIFNHQTGIIAALLALTSPNFWFHGEVALSYTSEAFFSALFGLLCWRVSRGEKRDFWLSIALLALAGGFRQNTPFFLIPLWLYATRKESIGKIFSAFIVFTIISLSWFLPMVLLTGGFESYLAAFNELMRFNTGHVSVMEKGLPALKTYARILHSFITYTLGAALPCTLLAFYVLLRNRSVSALKNPKTIFFTCWSVPSLLFYLFFFIHQDNPGYVLLLMPPLVLIAAHALAYLSYELSKLLGKSIHRILYSLVILINSAIFLFPHNALSRYGINDHDRDIDSIRNSLKRFNPETTIFFVGPYTFYSYRHLMLYLPEFTVFQVDTRTSSTGEKRKLFGGSKGSSFITDDLTIPKNIKSFAALTVADDKNIPKVSSKLSVKKVTPDFVIVSGQIRYLLLLYPELKPYVKPDKYQEILQPKTSQKITLPQKKDLKNGSPE
ncbi:MAG: glycosyltransferase family 39 protein [Geobacteraceae bacterium]